MKYLFNIILLTLIIAGPAAAAEKLGYVNLAKLLSTSPQHAQLNKEFQSSVESAMKKLKDDENTIRGLKERYTKDALTMSKDKRSDLEKDLYLKERKFKWDNKVVEEDLQIMKKSMEAQLRQTVIKTIQDYGKDKGFDFIFVDGVVYAGETVDLTDEIMNALKRQ